MNTEQPPLPGEPASSPLMLRGRPLIRTLLSAGAALLLVIIVLVVVLVRGAGVPTPVDGADPVPLDSTPTPSVGSASVPTSSATPDPQLGSEQDDASDDSEPETTSSDEDDAEGVQDHGGVSGPPISLLGVSSITVTGPGGISLAQVCSPGNNPEAYGANHDKQPAIMTWVTTGAKKTTLDVNGTLVFAQPANGSHQFVFDCFSNTGGINTLRFEVNAADQDLNVKSAVVYANVNGTSGLKFE